MRWLAVGAILLASCSVGLQAPPGSTGRIGASSTTNAPESTTTTAPLRLPAAYRVSECSGTPLLSYAVLCESFDEVVALHVDAPDPEALAAAAAVGVAAAPIETESAVVVTDFECVTPHASFEAVCRAIADRAAEGPMDMSVMVTSAVQGMFRYGLDPFSSYVSGAELDAGFDSTGLVLDVGMVVAARDREGAACGPIGGICRFEVLTVFEFGAGDEAGVSVGDVILAVDGEPLEGLSMAEATSLLAGVPGTSVTLSVDREGTALERSLTRQDIRLEPSEADFLDGGIVYLRLNDFSQQAAIDLGAFLQLPEVEAASGMILDLRDNPGGLVLAAQAVASQFLDGGVVFVERGRDFVEEIPVLEGGLADDDLSLVVLVNRASASAAEIVAAVLAERGRAIVLGEPTFGKNLVQFYQTTRDGGQIGITIARWETPGGLDIGIRGLQPDVEVMDDPTTDVDEAVAAAIDVLGG